MRPSHFPLFSFSSYFKRRSTRCGCVHGSCIGGGERRFETNTRADELTRRKQHVFGGSQSGAALGRLCSQGTVRARTENGPRKAKHESTANPKVSGAEASLVRCLEDLSKCTHESRVAAWGMKGVREARVGRVLPGVKRHKRRGDIHSHPFNQPPHFKAVFTLVCCCKSLLSPTNVCPPYEPHVYSIYLRYEPQRKRMHHRVDETLTSGARSWATRGRVRVDLHTDVFVCLRLEGKKRAFVIAALPLRLLFLMTLRLVCGVVVAFVPFCFLNHLVRFFIALYCCTTGGVVFFVSRLCVCVCVSTAETRLV